MRKRLAADERGIEGLPIRLVIALVVGVAALSVMMGMISGVEGLAVSEVDARPTPDVITPGESHDLSVQVVDADGEPVSNATVIVRGDSATLEAVHTDETDDSGVANVTVTPSLGPNQEQGTLAIDIQPPANDDYTDERANTEILVIEGTADE